jgi:hypothetical protein
MNVLDQRLLDLRPPAALSHRATVCFWSGSIEEKVDFTTWLTAWRKQITYLSHDYGCGCGIHLFDLEGPWDAIAALPQALLTISTWTEEGIKQPPRSFPASVVA